MKIGIVTYAKAPYRKLQWEKIGKHFNLKLYYTGKNISGRSWNVGKLEGINEEALPVISKFGKYGYLNKGLFKVVKENDYIIIGGYEHPSYILISILCRLLKKPYIILYDGISPKKLAAKENAFKFFLKNLVVKYASGFFANGTVSKEYFVKKFNVNENKIFNQVLPVDVDTIMSYRTKRNKLNESLRLKYDIPLSKKVLIFSGRLLELKNTQLIIKAINLLENKSDFTLLILGGGAEEENLVQLSRKTSVDIRITGFISDQQELFQHYYIGDMLILPSINEVWGLVVNEAMAAGLPVLVSEECGCVKDLVVDNYNGYIFDPQNSNQLALKIKSIYTGDSKRKFSLNSNNIIKKWKVEKSLENFRELMNFVSK